VDHAREKIIIVNARTPNINYPTKNINVWSAKSKQRAKPTR